MALLQLRRVGQVGGGAALDLIGVAFQPLALAADRTSATPPQALGEAMEVPFIS